MKLVSVVITAYNQGRWVREAVDSALGSSYKNLEVVIVNDGSTDEETLAVLSSFPKGMVRVINQDNKGVCYARNAGVLASKGDYVITLDGDDILSPDYIEHAVDVLSSDETVALVGGNYAEFEGNEVCKVSQHIPSGIVGNLLMCINFMSNTCLYRKKDWRIVKGYSLDLNRLALEDWDFLMKFVVRRKKIMYLDRVACYYRKHEGSRNVNRRKARYARMIMLFRFWRWYLRHPRFLLPYINWPKHCHRVSDVSFTSVEVG